MKRPDRTNKKWPFAKPAAAFRSKMPRCLPCVVFGFGIVLLCVSVLFRFCFWQQPTVSAADISSLLTGTMNMAELSTAEYKYRGIADIYSDDLQKILCRACYCAIVKAGIDFQDVSVSVDEDHQTILFSLPEIRFKAMIVDEQSMALLPHDADVEPGVLLRYCKADVEEEAKASTELMDAARTNLKSTIEGLAYPIAKQHGYAIAWRDADTLAAK